MVTPAEPKPAASAPAFRMPTETSVLGALERVLVAGRGGGALEVEAAVGAADARVETLVAELDLESESVASPLQPGVTSHACVAFLPPSSSPRMDWPPDQTRSAFS